MSEPIEALAARLRALHEKSKPTLAWWPIVNGQTTITYDSETMRFHETMYRELPALLAAVERANAADALALAEINLADWRAIEPVNSDEWKRWHLEYLSRVGAHRHAVDAYRAARAGAGDGDGGRT